MHEQSARQVTRQPRQTVGRRPYRLLQPEQKQDLVNKGGHQVILAEALNELPYNLSLIGVIAGINYARRKLILTEAINEDTRAESKRYFVVEKDIVKALKASLPPITAPSGITLGLYSPQEIIGSTRYDQLTIEQKDMIYTGTGYETAIDMAKKLQTPNKTVIGAYAGMGITLACLSPDQAIRDLGGRMEQYAVTALR